MVDGELNGPSYHNLTGCPVLVAVKALTGRLGYLASSSGDYLVLAEHGGIMGERVGHLSGESTGEG
jgi:hypothetical protein